MNSWVVFRGRPIQDGRLTAIFGQNLLWAITVYWIEPLEELNWNCSIILSTSKWTAELLFRGRLIQDGRLTAIYGRNLFWAITRYWIEILTSNFVCWYRKIKTYDFLSRSSDSRWPTDRHIWSKPILGHKSVLDWDIDFKISVLVPQNEQLSWLFVMVIRFKMAD